MKRVSNDDDKARKSKGVEDPNTRTVDLALIEKQNETNKRKILSIRTIRMITIDYLNG